MSCNRERGKLCKASTDFAQGRPVDPGMHPGLVVRCEADCQVADGIFGDALDDVNEHKPQLGTRTSTKSVEHDLYAYLEAMQT